MSRKRLNRRHWTFTERFSGRFDKREFNDGLRDSFPEAVVFGLRWELGSGRFKRGHVADCAGRSRYTACSHGNTKTWSGNMPSPLAASCSNRNRVKASMRRYAN